MRLIPRPRADPLIQVTARTGMKGRAGLWMHRTGVSSQGFQRGARGQGADVFAVQQGTLKCRRL